VAYDADGLPLGEHVYAKGASILDLCRVGRGWACLEFASFIRSDSCIMPPTKFPRHVEPFATGGVTRARRGLLAGFWWKSGAII
jgi:hypothetical protein